MYLAEQYKLSKLDSKTLKDLKYKEADLEEILRSNIEILSGDDESLLIVGQQVRTRAKGRSDLIAIDSNGYLVLIEIKRDKFDSESRKEPFEIQAIRYAASNATISDYQTLVKRVYSPYIEKHKDEYDLDNKSASEFALKNIEEFLDKHNAYNTFNQKQRIILVASEIDEQTKSAVAWLNHSGVDIQCFELDVYVIEGKTYFSPRKILPLLTYEDFYIGIREPGEKSSSNSGITRRNLPRIEELLDQKVVSAGDIIIPKDHPGEAKLLKNGNVDVDGTEMSMQVWLKNLYGWASIQTYVFAVHKEKGKTLSQLRKEYMDKKEINGD
jgi:hypothetical protein